MPSQARSLPGAVPVPRRRRLQAGQRSQRRRARPPGAGDPGAGGRQLAAAGRADQPPGYPGARSAAGGAGGFLRHHPAGLARPLPDRPPGDPDLGAARTASCIIFKGSYREYVLRRAAAALQRAGSAQAHPAPPSRSMRADSKETQRRMRRARPPGRAHPRPGA